MRVHAEGAMSTKSINTLIADRCRAEVRVLRAARAYAAAGARLDLPAMEDTSAEMMLAAFRLRDADENVAAWKREARKRLRAAAARREP